MSEEDNVPLTFFLSHLLLSYFSLSFCGRSQAEAMMRENDRIVNSFVVYIVSTVRIAEPSVLIEVAFLSPYPVISFYCVSKRKRKNKKQSGCSHRFLKSTYKKL